MRKQNIWETISSVEKKEFQQKILGWYEKNKRDLPWRKTQDPYKILVSEIMLQQTQVSSVIQKFNGWMKKWPTVLALAQSSRVEVLSEWSGLGFNRRAIYLHEASKKIIDDALSVAWYNRIQNNWVDNWMNRAVNRPIVSKKSLHQASFPQVSDKMWDKCEQLIAQSMQDYSYLRTLPWVGEYTANAILAFSYNFEVPVIDINIKRVLIHAFGLAENISLFDLQVFALSLVPLWKSREWHNALMDYGSMVLHSKATGIQSAKQSPFTGSDREVRGWILKQLVEDKTPKTIGIKWKKSKSLSFDTIQTRFPEKNIEKIIAWLEKEGTVTEKGKKIRLRF